MSVSQNRKGLVNRRPTPKSRSLDRFVKDTFNTFANTLN